MTISMFYSPVSPLYDPKNKQENILDNTLMLLGMRVILVLIIYVRSKSANKSAYPHSLNRA